ncbi:hypothetical protein Zmor_006865 [Zophobas morio]|uniref:Uncharacterized protein n=1 Tax=Zophobas morio TaxID=2755281 RepID=A0AA38ISL1_9CUCU|nr:hypothetical protein Zmor_027276 [Zophobas morio]KAJ3662520.1 hypothetical protein Zmor_006865 [Zophobas morio]
MTKLKEADRQRVKGSTQLQQHKRFVDESRHKKECQRCGSSHPPRSCPAFNKYCGACNCKVHYAKMCRNKVNVNSVEEDELHDRDSKMFCGKIRLIAIGLRIF